MTFRGPCIVTYSCNKSQRVASVLNSLADANRTRMTNTSCCEYSVETPDDGQQICPKHVEFFFYIYIFWTVHLCIILVDNQLDAQFFSMVCLFESSTCFEQLCAHPQEDSCINTTSGIITLF